ncbi:ROK family protein [Pseudooceanicola sediminis]|uniref:ROK family protein n=1 Tax=Pseudooceanicola sediminis TaxID=2211117 RepID=A0A399IYX7_9RHOB|nr:ROK family protein [Pseudooceanicola sediminis]KAA2316054.1 ROK family protein [Puniceibacterium sp. HSS470]RII38164.1 ROK family protein [Pseudooceanicola sediminis]|tara:strand:- start:3877 stop:5157 length:1281 start_codon:yes stop_codon:yes gene_type:complete
MYVSDASPEPPLAPTEQAPTGCGPILSVSGHAAKNLRQQIFEAVRAAGRTTRADVTRSLGISAGSATTLSAELIAAGFLREVEGLAREAGRGRPPVALEVVPDARLVIGLKLSDQVHTAVLTDFAGTVLANASQPTPPTRKSLEDILAEVETLVAALLAQAGCGVAAISAMGVGLPGLVDHPAGHVVWSPLLRLRDLPLAEALQDRFGLPVQIDNDANMLTLAELWFGAGRARSDFAVVTIEEGVGMGVVLNHQLFRGSRGVGLELGHTKVHLDGALCRCGQRGCLEAYVADYALAREAATALDRSAHNRQSAHALLETLFAEAKAGNESARTIFSRAARYLSLGLANVVQLFDPELIILSGERMQYDYLYADEMMAEMRALTVGGGRVPCAVELHAWGDMVWARGASALALSAVTDSVLGERWAA